MAVRIQDILDPEELAWDIQENYVRTQEHLDLPLTIYNYTEKCQYDRYWTPTTRVCRGLIATHEHTVVARPFPKFFNKNEGDAPSLDLDSQVAVTDKLDGSLGILYPLMGQGHAIATRGSFTSPQAVHATRVWNDRYSHKVDLYPDETYLFEIIYPGNRIVLDYGSMDDLVLLAAIDIATGKSTEAWDIAGFVWPGKRVERYNYPTLADALAAPSRRNREGLVIRVRGTEDRIKVKQEDYIELHRIVTGMNERSVWEYLREWGEVETLLEPLPEEFHGWVRNVADDLFAKHAAILEDVRDEYQYIVDGLDWTPVWTRKDFALHAKDSENSGLLFLMLDGKDDKLSDMIWKNIKPAGNSMVPVSEDVA